MTSKGRGRVALLAAALVLQPACAGISFKRAADPKTNGIRYYRPATYFLVQPDYAKGQASVTTFHGPDTCQLFAAKPYAFLATNTSKIEFTGGMLSTVSTDSDATAIPRAVIQATAAVSKELLEIAAKGAKLSAMGAALVAEDKTAAGVSRPPIFLFVSDSSGGFAQVYPTGATTNVGCDPIGEEVK